MSAKAALGEVCEHVQQSYPPEGEGRYERIKSIYKELIEELNEVFRSLKVTRTTPDSRPLEEVDIEMGHVPSKLDECLKQSEPGRSTTKFCGKVIKAFKTALRKLEHEIPVLSTIRANCPPMRAILAGQVVTLLYTVCFQDSFQQTDSLFGAFFQVGVNAMIGGLATDFIWCDGVEPILNKIQSLRGANTIPRA